VNVKCPQETKEKDRIYGINGIDEDIAEKEQDLFSRNIPSFL